MNFPRIPVSELHKILHFSQPFNPDCKSGKSLVDWRMEIDDAPIFRYLYRNFSPKRHLEFGTWQGQGATYCLDECQATVWTLNLPFGELTSSGKGAYGYYPEETEELLDWVQKIGIPIKTYDEGVQKPKNFIQNLFPNRPAHSLNFRTDSVGFIGRQYLNKNLGNRVCQIYCDSTQWDISAYPLGFFDSALIDGGHTFSIVKSDTERALKLVRPGGLILWHDFCPDPEVLSKCSSPREVIEYFQKEWDTVNEQMEFLTWIEPSWILLGKRRQISNG